jgi:hypothetical protein
VLPLSFHFKNSSSIPQQSVSPYHTVTAIDSNSQTTIKYNAWLLSQHLKGQKRSNSLSDSFDDYRSTEINRSLLGDTNKHFCDSLKKSYADILYCFGLLSQRAQVLKYLSIPPAFNGVESNGVEFVTECQSCRKTTRGPSCLHCKTYLFNCSLCQLPVRGSANACLICGHGGHTVNPPHLLT